MDPYGSSLFTHEWAKNMGGKTSKPAKDRRH